MTLPFDNRTWEQRTAARRQEFIISVCVVSICWVSMVVSGLKGSTTPPQLLRQC
jgi:hypothetical protein